MDCDLAILVYWHIADNYLIIDVISQTHITDIHSFNYYYFNPCVSLYLSTTKPRDNITHKIQGKKI